MIACQGSEGQSQVQRPAEDQEDGDDTDEMQQELIAQQAEKAAEAVRFSLSALSTREDWAPPGPHFP